MEEKSKNGAGPKFDFSKVTRQWNRDFGRTMTDAARAQLIMQREPDDDMTTAEFNALLDRQEQAVLDIEKLADQQAELLVQVLVDVPNAWLLADAPTPLDWSDVKSLDYIQADRYGEILERLRSRNIAGDDAKNSDGQSRSRRKHQGQ